MERAEFFKILQALNFEVMICKQGTKKFPAMNNMEINVQYATVILHQQRVKISLYKDPKMGFRYWCVTPEFAPVNKPVQNSPDVMKVRALCDNMHFHDKCPRVVLENMAKHLFEKFEEPDDATQEVQKINQSKSQQSEKPTQLLRADQTMEEDFASSFISQPEVSPDKTVEAQFVTT